MKRWNIASGLALASLGGLSLAQFDSHAPTDPRAEQVKLSGCDVEGLDGSLECGELSVRENRDEIGGRRITLHFLIARANGVPSRRRPDPLFFVTGGPGLSSIDAAPRIVTANPEVRQSRDIVFLDQRGAGRSNPLNCEISDRGTGWPTAGDFEACYKKLRDDTDIDQYVTTEATHDIEDVRRALNYGRINLLGISYGTILIQELIRRHPGSVRSAMLMSAYGPDDDVFQVLPAGAQAALDNLVLDCGADPACNRAFPKLRNTVSDLFSRLRDGRATAQPAESAQAAATATVLPSYRDVTRAVSLGLYRTDLAASLPLGLHLAAQGDLDSLLSVYRQFGKEFGGGYAHGLYAVALCSEDLPFANLEKARLRAAESFVGDGTLANAIELCGVWPRSPIREDYKSQVTSSIPTLIVNGGLDPITTIESGRRVADGFPNSRLVVVPKMAHLAGNAWEACLGPMLSQFLENPEPALLDTGCADRVERPGFRISPRSRIYGSLRSRGLH